MSARRDVGTALKKKDKLWKETHVIVCINLKKKEKDNAIRNSNKSSS